MTVKELKELLNTVDENIRIIVESEEDCIELEDCFESYSNGEEVFIIRG